MRNTSISLFLVAALFSCAEEPAIENLGPSADPTPYFIRVIEDEVEGTPIVLAGGAGLDFAVAFDRRLNGKELSFQPDDREMPIILKDQEGNRWDMFGVAVEGVRKGERLTPVRSTRGYWFAFGGMFPGVDIYGAPSFTVQLPPADSSPLWLVSPDFLVAGALFDQIRTIDEPKAIRYNVRDDLGVNFFLEENDLVIVVRLGDQVRAYPKKLLGWHEIINDTLNGIPIAVTYHPLSGTTMVWERTLLHYFETTLGVSGLMYNVNMVAFDRATTSYWSQLLGKCIGGPLGGAEPVVVPCVELTWGQWRSMQQKPEVISDDTGFARDYTLIPYPTYPTREEFPDYPIAFRDRRLPLKERVFGVMVGGKAKVYRMEAFR
ncbi:MAG: hypothetical protein KIPDCIKN_02828 [Haliscomenobacter sp.]|jgi:hypothetical protein|nr:hypothetical protein [Haliscomenobacter sp.]